MSGAIITYIVLGITYIVLGITLLVMAQEIIELLDLMADRLTNWMRRNEK